MAARQCRLHEASFGILRETLCYLRGESASSNDLQSALTRLAAAPTIPSPTCSSPHRSPGTRVVVGPQELFMARRLRIAAVGTLTVMALLMAILGGAYYAARQVRPFYEQALRVQPEVLEEGSRELESRATALYSDANQVGNWQALFTAQQINGWLATQLAADKGGELPANIRDPRIAIAPDVLTLGFRTKSGGVETVVSVDTSVMLTDDGAVGLRFISVRAGALPLPILQLADELAAACRKMNLPIRWTQQQGRPIAIVNITSNASAKNRRFLIDSIELRDGEMYVAGHTEPANGPAQVSRKPANSSGAKAKNVALDEYELRLTPTDQHSALEIARRPDSNADDASAAKR